MDEQKLKRLTKLFEITNEGLTREEFSRSFKSVIKLLSKMKIDLLQSINLKEEQEKARLDKVADDFGRKVDSILAMVKNGKDGVDGQSIEGRPGRDGTNAKEVDLDRIIDIVEKKIVVPTIDSREIEELKEQIENLRRTKKFGGGGFSKIAMEGKMVDDETPTGTVNGSNKAFTLLSAPNPIASLKVYVNGSRMRITEDYTLSGNVITFITAPPTNSIILVDYRK